VEEAARLSGLFFFTAKNTVAPSHLQAEEKNSTFMEQSNHL